VWALHSRGFMTRNSSFSRWLAVVSGLAIVIAVTVAAWRSSSVTVLALTVLLVLAAVAAAGLVWQRNNKVHYQNLVQAQEGLRESEEKLSSTLRSIGNAVISTDVQGRVVRMNPVAEELTGWVLSEAIGRPISEVINIMNALTHQPAAIPIDEVLSTGEVRHLANHTTLISRDGTQRQIADTAAPIRDDTGAIIGVVLVFSDVTEQHRVREELKEAGDRAQRYLDVAGVILVSIARDGTITLINKKGCELLGYPQQELLGRNWFEVCIPEREREEVKAVFDRLMRGESEPVEFFENTVVTRSGEERTIRWHNVPLRDATGAIIGTLSSGEDVTERKQAEEELRESEDKFRSLFECSRDAVMTLDPPSWKFASCNQATVEMFGAKDVEEVTSFAPWEVAPELQPDGRASADKAKEMNETAMREGSHSFEWTHTRISGEQFTATVLLSRIEQGGKTFLQSTVRDITERKQAEERLKRINECLLTLGPDFEENINRLTSLCGELLGATCALYNRLDGGMLCSVGRWSTPPDFNPVDKPDGHICYDVIKQGGNDTFIVRNLPDSVYWTSDPNVARYKLKTYFGQAVKCGNVSVGSLCAVFQDDFEPTEDEKRIMGIIASAVSTEELRKRAEEALRESEEQYRVIFEGSAYGIVMVDSKTRQFIYANPTVCRLFGYTEMELLQMGVADIHPKDSLDHVVSEFESMAAGEKTLASELPCLRKDGTVFYADVTTALTILKGGRECTVGFFTDVTDRRDLSQQVEVAVTQIRGLMTQVVTGNDLAGRFSNPRLSRCWEEKKCTKTDCPAYGNTGNLRCWKIVGTFCKGEVQGDFAKKYGDCTRCSVYQAARANPLLELGEAFNAMSAILQTRHEALVQSKAETEEANDQLVDALGDASEMASQAKNAKEQIKENAIELAYQASHDALTSLPNRQYFEQHLSELITGSASRKSRSMTVLFLDLDKFKLINDTLGHKVGDLLLIETGERLQSCLRSDDLLARMGGDEFTVILPRCRSRSIAGVVASRMIDSISRPFDIQGHKFVIGASIGLASYPSDGTDTITLLKHADAAMYKAKQAGRGTFRWFTGDVDVDNQQRANMEMDIRSALEKGQFNVYYQPIVSLEDGNILVAEALLRWDHPDKGMISPSLLIPIAEEIGLIGKIGDYVLRMACAQTMAWRDEGIYLSQIAVNVSTRQVRDVGWLDSVSAALADTGLDARCLNLELTETDFAADYESMGETLQEVQKLGICLSIDDFGMGQSSLSRLKDFPVIHLKIDGSFIRDIEFNNSDDALVRSIIEMAHGQCMKVTAEWVETESQMEILRSIGCDFAQGYFISPALPADKFREFARTRLASRNLKAA